MVAARVCASCAAQPNCAEAVAGAKRESKAAFGDDSLLLEKYLGRPRHVEIQVFADTHGNCIYLFERDCSIQRRHQKVIEEAPAPSLPDAVRARMGAAAVAAARAVNYVGAGTVEFLFEDGTFYFIEMNTRLQVEHPVTEMITGLDLVEWQLRVAAGERLPCTQEQLVRRGHAFEARLYAEDPQRGFLPATGRLTHLRPPPESAHVRVDTGVQAGDEISVYYDPMIAKLIVWDEDRTAALRRLRRALEQYEVAGVTTNIGFLAAIAAHPAFAEAEIDTGFIERHRDQLALSATPVLDEGLALAALAILLRRDAEAHQRPSGDTSAELAPGWLAVTRDPRPLLGLPAVDAHETGDLLSRRDASFAAVQEFYYRTPPQIERGRRHYLMSTAGRTYLDMVNNVTVLGHAHPRVADTAARQLRKLNTNSRFNYEPVVEFSERLAATLPEPLDTVFLVNSGSEASDLAIRLATAATGRRDVVAVREAYHGWTYGTDAVSTSTADNPNAIATRPDWVHTVESPNSFRGKYRGADAVRYAGDAVEQISRLAAEGRAPAGFICESVYGNAGGMALPDGYLQQVYAAVRAAGGLAISDEVQVGYGRLGEWFWGFHQQGVVPDIVSIAKSTGNGYPLGAVITSRAVADGFASQGYFFSSTGGSPLSCAIGLTVLDVLRDEGLQENAVRVGAHLKSRLQALQDKHAIIGTVHGIGLYLGVEMVRDLDDPGARAARRRRRSATGCSNSG